MLCVIELLMDSHQLFTVNEVIYVIDVACVLCDRCNVCTDRCNICCVLNKTYALFDRHYYKCTL